MPEGKPSFPTYILKKNKADKLDINKCNNLRNEDEKGEKFNYN